MLRRIYNPLKFIQNVKKISTSSSLQAELPLTFASPGQVFYKEKVVKQVDVPTLSGSFGIVAEHVPTIGCLKPGVVVITEDDGAIKKFFVSSGTVTVNDNSSVQILAEEAITLDMLDRASITEGLSKAQQDMSSASSDELKAEAQIALDCWEALNKAVDEK